MGRFGIFNTRSAIALIVTCVHMCVVSNAEERWPSELQIGQFSIHADFDIRQESELLRQLGDLTTDVSKTLEISIHPEPIHIVLFDSQAKYQAYMKQYFPDVPFRRALFIKRRGPGMVFAFRSREMQIDLRHETTHALLNASLPYVPLWLDEGLAEYFEAPARGDERPHPHQKTTKRWAFWGQSPSIAELEAIGELSEMGSREYQKSWSCVHFLIHESPETKAILVRFLQDLQAHSPPGQLSKRVNASIPAWKSRFLTYFRQ